MTLNSQGERFVGDHVGHYGDGDLVLVGPNLPHAWQSRAALHAGVPHRALVVWFSERWARALTEQYAELAPLGGLLTEAGRGLSFSPALRAQARTRLLNLGARAPAARWLGLVELLLLLASDAGREPLATHGFVATAPAPDQARLERVLTHLHDHYAEPVGLATLAALAHMSISQLQRFFKRCTRSTVSGYLAQLRVGRACALLMHADRPLSLIAVEAGYGQQSYFTRQFRALKGVTPGEFRRRFQAATAPPAAVPREQAIARARRAT